MLIQSGCHESFVGRLDIVMVDGEVSTVDHELVLMDKTIQGDAEMQREVDSIYAPHRSSCFRIWDFRRIANWQQRCSIGIDDG